ncbi:Methionine S-methyltransferase -like protein [Gossypium arboreum]|uniref:Methionine S-methyltransferase-like protein n=1 Tax=Gossypium arboreum TaxID=29729 RepID=A0A0B0MY52_GOSAR|nr:Methionine S-methyltransferase -like protein [Gossypium arboreum]
MLQTAENGLSDDVVTVIEAPRQSDLMIELIKRLKPQVVVTGIAHFEAVTSSAFVQLLDATGEIGSRLFLDISDHFELSSLPGTIGVLKYLSGTPLPSHAAIVCGLVYSDLEVAFVISEEEAILKALSKTVEILEGNTSLISQYYYGCIFHELLSFQLTDRHPNLERRSEKSKSVEVIGFTTSAISVLSNAELSISDEGYPLVRMDVDQWFLPVPSPVKAAIFESFARQNMTESEIDVTPCIKQFVQTEYGFPTDSGTEFIFSDCSQALFSKLVLCCIQEGGTMCFPDGSNGNYVSVAKFLKANTVHIPTNPERGFKLTEEILIKALETMKKPWVYISGPTINPTGLLYSNQEMENILSACARFGARVVIDTSFSGLEFEYEGRGGWNLGSCLSKISSSGNPSFCVSLLGGLSLKLLSGALKFAFLALNEPILIEAFHSFPGLSKPHCTDKYTIKKLLSLIEQKGGLLDVAMEQIRILENRAKCLKEVLENCGWDVLRPCAGVSMVAKPSFLGKAVKVNHSLKHTGSGEKDATYEIKLTDASLREAVAKTTGLCINSGSWTGIPGYCRFTIALEESEFEQALACLVKFKSIVDN